MRGELNAERERLRSELNLAEHELHDLMRDAGDGAGNDQADVGSTTFERDHEMSLANNARDMLAQTERALGEDRGRHLRRLRELWGADRQDAVDGVPACDTVPVMQAARGASLNPSDHRSTLRPGGDPARRPAAAAVFAAHRRARLYARRRDKVLAVAAPDRPGAGAGRRRLLHALPRAQPGRRVQHRHVVHRRAHLRRDRRRGRRAVGVAAGSAAPAGRSVWGSCWPASWAT